MKSDANIKTKTKLVKMNTPEYVSKDILEEDFVKSFKLLTYVQMALGSCRLHSKDRFVTSPTIYQKIYTLLCIIITITLYIIIIRIYSSKYKENINVYHLVATAILVDLAVYVTNMIQVRFLNGDANIDFFIQLQIMDRLMKIENNSILISMLRMLNNITYIVFITVLLSFLALLIFMGGVNVYFCSVIISQITFLSEIANCSNYIVYFFMRIRFVNSIISNHVNPERAKQRPKFYLRIIATKRWMRYMAAQSHNFALCDTEIYLKAIFEGFKRLQDVYRFQVFMFCVKLVLVSLITFEFVLFGVQSNLLKLMEVIFIMMYSLVNYWTVVIMSIRYSYFFREVKETKCLSIGILMKYQDGPLRQKAKRMLKMIEESPPCFSVYDMWHMDAHISLKIFSLITSLVVTLLQFAFL